MSKHNTFLITLKYILSLMVAFSIIMLLNQNTGNTDQGKENTGSESDTARKVEIDLPLKPPEMELKLRTPEESKLKRVVPNQAFGEGERFVFSVGWEFINAGTAVMEIQDIVKFKGHKCYHIVSTAKSNKFFSVFFKVDDKVESYMDVHGLYSWRYDKHLREGTFKADVSMYFDQENHLAIYNEGKDTFEVAEYAQDVLSAFYYVRTQDLMVGSSIFVPNHTDKKNYPLEVKVLRKERVKVPAGEFDCVVVEPILQTPGIFEHKGSLKVWLTDDQVKMPVLMKSKVVIGSIATELIEYKLGEVGKL